MIAQAATGDHDAFCDLAEMPFHESQVHWPDPEK